MHSILIPGAKLATLWHSVIEQTKAKMSLLRTIASFAILQRGLPGSFFEETDEIRRRIEV